MPIVEKKDALMDAINIAATARAWAEKEKKKRLYKKIAMLAQDLDNKQVSSNKIIPIEEDTNGNEEDDENNELDAELVARGSSLALPPLISKLVRMLPGSNPTISVEESEKKWTESHRKKLSSRRRDRARNKFKYWFFDLLKSTARPASATTLLSKTLVKSSLFCFHMKETKYFTYFRHILTCMTYVAALMACDREALEGTDDYPAKTMSIADYLVNIGFIILGLVRIMVFPLFVAFSDHTKHSEILGWIFRKSGLFDVGIGALCIVYATNTEVGQWLRLVRMTVISIILVDSVDSLDVLLSGIFNGVRSIKYSLAVMCVVTVAWGFVSLQLFGKNDPYHFGGLGTSMWSLIEIMTLDSWRMVVDINSYGCDMDRYETIYTIYTPLVQDCMNSSVVDFDHCPPALADLGHRGKFSLPYCNQEKSTPRPLAAGFVFNSYVMITAFILWNLNTAAVTTGISEKVQMMKEESEEAEDTEKPSVDLVTTSNSLASANKKGKLSLSTAARVASFSARLHNASNATRGKRYQNLDINKMRLLLKNAWKEDTGLILSHTKDEHLIAHRVARDERNLHYWLIAANFYIAPFAHTTLYIQAMDMLTVTGCIMTLALVSTGDMSILVECSIQTVFTVDVILTALAAYPNYHSFKSWDWSDAIITLLTWPLITEFVQQSDFKAFLHALRVLKCLRILDQFPDVHIIFQSLKSSTIALSYVAGLILLTAFHFAMAASIMFRHNDPNNFRAFWPALQAMFQVATLDDWAKIARLNIIGCDYSTAYLEIDDDACTCGEMNPVVEGLARPCGMGWIAALFFLLYIMVVVIIMMNLLIAIIIASMEMLRDTMIHEKKMWAKVEHKMDEYHLTYSYTRELLKVYDMLDISEHGKLSLVEITPILELVSVNEETQLKIFHEVDRDNSGSIDFAEFCELVHLLKQAHDIIKSDDSVTTAQKMEDLLHMSPDGKNSDKNIHKMALLGTEGESLSAFFGGKNEEESVKDSYENYVITTDHERLKVPHPNKKKMLYILSTDKSNLSADGAGYGSPFNTPQHSEGAPTPFVDSLKLDRSKSPASPRQNSAKINLDTDLLFVTEADESFDEL